MYKITITPRDSRKKTIVEENVVNYYAKNTWLVLQRDPKQNARGQTVYKETKTYPADFLQDFTVIDESV